MKSFLYVVAVVGVLSIATFPMPSQQQVQVLRPVTRSHGLSLEQLGQIRSSLNDSTDMTALAGRVAAARKEALEIALDKNATETAVREKIEAVAKLQVEIAMLRYQTGVKAILPSVTDEQKSQMLEASGAAYNQLFVGNSSGSEFIRGGRFVPKNSSEN